MQKNKSSRLGLYGVIGDVVITIAYFLAFNTSLPGTSSLNTNTINAGCAVLALILLLTCSMPSFKKTPYPNVLGTLGVVINAAIIVQCVWFLSTIGW